MCSPVTKKRIRGDRKMGQTKKLSGGCLCGAAKFTATPENHHVGACHCDMCRRWTAGPFLTVGCTDTLEIEDNSAISVYKSSEWAERHFCSKCGSTLWYKFVSSNEHFVSAGVFDDTTGFKFQHQIFVDEKPDFYTFSNETKNMTGAEVIAAFAPPSDGGNNV